MRRVVSGWEQERIADYGVCGVGLGARTDSGLWRMWCRTRTDHAFETKWNKNVGLTIFLLSGLVATVYDQHTIHESSVKKLGCPIPLSNNYVWVFFFLWPYSTIWHTPPRLDVSTSHTHTHTHTHKPVALLCTSDQPVADAATYKTHKKRKIRTSMPLMGFEPAIPTISTAVPRLTAHGNREWRVMWPSLQNRTTTTLQPSASCFQNPAK
jgi:hypothetical protein